MAPKDSDKHCDLYSKAQTHYTIFSRSLALPLKTDLSKQKFKITLNMNIFNEYFRAFHVITFRQESVDHDLF